MFHHLDTFFLDSVKKKKKNRKFTSASQHDKFYLYILYLFIYLWHILHFLRSLLQTHFCVAKQGEKIYWDHKLNRHF